MPAARSHLAIRITGSVQGVFFRHSARMLVLELGLAGFVRNELDGSLTIEVEGDEKRLQRFFAWCREGPPSARVERVTVDRRDWQNLKGFRIL